MADIRIGGCCDYSRYFTSRIPKLGLASGRDHFDDGAPVGGPFFYSVN